MSNFRIDTGTYRLVNVDIPTDIFPFWIGGTLTSRWKITITFMGKLTSFGLGHGFKFANCKRLPEGKWGWQWLSSSGCSGEDANDPMSVEFLFSCQCGFTVILCYIIGIDNQIVITNGILLSHDLDWYSGISSKASVILFQILQSLISRWNIPFSG